MFSKRQTEFERICRGYYCSRNMTKHQKQIYVLFSLFLVLSLTSFPPFFPSGYLFFFHLLPLFLLIAWSLTYLPFVIRFLRSASFQYFNLPSPIFVLVSHSFSLFKLWLYLWDRHTKSNRELERFNSNESHGVTYHTRGRRHSGERNLGNSMYVLQSLEVLTQRRASYRNGESFYQSPFFPFSKNAAHFSKFIDSYDKNRHV